MWYIIYYAIYYDIFLLSQYKILEKLNVASNMSLYINQ